MYFNYNQLQYVSHHKLPEQTVNKNIIEVSHGLKIKTNNNTCLYNQTSAPEKVSRLNKTIGGTVGFAYFSQCGILIHKLHIDQDIYRLVTTRKQ